MAMAGDSGLAERRERVLQVPLACETGSLVTCLATSPPPKLHTKPKHGAQGVTTFVKRHHHKIDHSENVPATSAPAPGSCMVQPKRNLKEKDLSLACLLER
eukprot:215486-Amphidinium_carterae.1